MKVSRHLSLVLIVFLASAACAAAQTKFRWTFLGTSYQTNASGNIVPTPLTERTLIEDAARRGGLQTNQLAIIYQVKGSDFGDTVNIITTNNGATVFSPFGYFFGEDASLGRTALTNSTHTEQRRVDYVYTLSSSTYTSPQSHSMGAAFITKRFVSDTNGNVHTTIEGPMHWLVVPQGTNGTKVCHGYFTTGLPF